ncbi:MAG: hypothetical protein AB7G75_05140 [Candidatus Binatia bacterium]
MNPFTFLRVTLATVSGLLLALPMVICGLPFWLVSALTRAGSRLFCPLSVPWNQIIEFDPLMGWKPKANLDVFCSFIAGSFHVKTDALGWRGKATIEESQVVIFGDSYVFGYGIDENSLFTDQDRTVRMKGIGAPGYNMVQSFLWMQKLAPQLRKKLVVWFICVGNDLYDNLQMNMQSYPAPFVRTTNGATQWEITTTHVNPAKWLYNAERDHARLRKGRYVAAFGTTLLSERAYAACEFLLQQGKEVCDRAEGTLVVVTVPHLAQFSPSDWDAAMSEFGDPKGFHRHLPDEKIGAICRKLSICFVAGKDCLQLDDHILEDGHWNARGHRRIAAALEKLYRRLTPRSEHEQNAHQPDTANARIPHTADYPIS